MGKFLERVSMFGRVLLAIYRIQSSSCTGQPPHFPVYKSSFCTVPSDFDGFPFRFWTCTVQFLDLTTSSGSGRQSWSLTVGWHGTKLKGPQGRH